jgi:PAS domain S-box-containing protein
MSTPRSIPGTLLRNSAALATVSILLLGVLWIREQYLSFVEGAQIQRAALTEARKAELKDHVDQAIDYIEYMKSRSETRAREIVKNRTHEAHTLASHLWNTFNTSHGPDEVQALVRESLRPIRYNGDRGYFFATSLDGVEQLFADRPEFEGVNLIDLRDTQGAYVIRDMIALAAKQGEGFYDYTWSKPDAAGKGFPKIAFIKLFTPFNWIIGTGEYLDDVEREIQEEVAQRLEQIRFGRDGYIFAGRWDGVSVTAPAKGKNMFEVTDPNGVKIVQELIAQARGGGGFVSYVMPKLEGRRPSLKISYAKSVDSWQWYVGAGVYLDDIDEGIENARQAMVRDVQTTIGKTLGLLAVLLLAALLVASRAAARTRRTFEAFSDFFHKAASEAAEIRAEGLAFSELQDLAVTANQMLSERKRAEERLRAVLKGTSAVTGTEFFRSLARHLATALNVRNALVAELIDGGRARTLAIWAGGQYLKDLEYDLDGTPCSRLSDGGYCFYPDRVQELFPQARFLTELGAVSFQGAPLFDRSGNPVGLLAVLNDAPADDTPLSRDLLQLFAGRASAEIARLRAEELTDRLAAAVEQAEDDILLTNPEGVIQYVNPAFERTTGYTREEALGQTPRLLKSGKHGEEFYQDLWQTIRRGETWLGRIMNRRKDGGLILQDVTISPIRDSEGRLSGFVSTRRDITRHVELEAQLAQVQKLEALGKLAGGIAHDFNNILSAVMGYTEMALLELPKGSNSAEKLERVLQASTRAADLVRQILAFSRQTRQEAQPVAIKPLIKETLKLLRATLPSTIETREEILADPVVIADPGQIHQIVMNLCTNAARAMRDQGGVLTVSLTEGRTGLSEEAEGLTEQRFATLSVSDTGCGMPDEIVQKVFDPFFTQWHDGAGTGMGLAVVHGIVHSCGGEISVRSTQGNGTIFEVILPTVEMQQAASVEAGPRPRTGSERILFVDDEKMLRDLAADHLGTLGYQVTTARDGQEAWELFEGRPDSFDAVVTDMTMPRMTGDVLAAKIKASRPEKPVILCTGYNEKLDEESTRALRIDELAMKPISGAAISVLLRKIMDTPPVGAAAPSVEDPEHEEDPNPSPP